MTNKEREWLIVLAERTTNEQDSRDAMHELRQINKTYHWCNEWDGMVICDEDPEWDACLCNLKETKDIEN